ncbi:NAD(P)-binding protein [Dentipellis sp. KUC8613]|nr:NAD(P)-binding protein [Dentipellis sp. KUC8613]
MATISDTQLVENAHRVKGKVVVLTGGASGIGKEAVLLFAKHGAKVVIGDLDLKGAEAVASQARRAGGEAIAVACNVLKWDDLVDMFELAISKYGTVDVVVPNAGVNELSAVCTGHVSTGEDGKLLPPKLPTVQINLEAVIQTVHLGLWYLKKNRTAGQWKSVVLIGSMASWNPIPGGPQYTAAKHAILGFMRSLYPTLDAQDIRVASIHPFYADTNILPAFMKAVLAGIPLVPVPRIAGAIFFAAVDPDRTSSGCPLLLLDDGPVYRLPKEDLRVGVYDQLNKHVVRPTGIIEAVKLNLLFLKDIGRVVLPSASTLAVASSVAAGAGFLWYRRL